MAFFDFGVTTCKTTKKWQKEGRFTTPVPVDPQKLKKKGLDDHGVRFLAKHTLLHVSGRNRLVRTGSPLMYRPFTSSNNLRKLRRRNKLLEIPKNHLTSAIKSTINDIM